MFSFLPFFPNCVKCFGLVFLDTKLLVWLGWLVTESMLNNLQIDTPVMKGRK